MPTIPTGRGRRVLPGNATRTATGEAVGAESGRAAMQFGETLFNAGVTDIELHARETRRQEAIADAAKRQADALTMNDARDQLQTAHDEIADGVKNGTIAKDEAEVIWRDQSASINGEALGKVSPRNQVGVKLQLEQAGTKLGGGVRKAVESRNMHDIRGGIDQTLEYASRMYATDQAGATKLALGTLAEMGPFSGWQPDELQRKGQAWKESTQFTRAYSAVSAGRADSKALDAAQKLIDDGSPDLDPQKRATLNDRVQAYRLAIEQKAEMAAARRQREADAHLKRAEAAFNTFQTMADKGTVLDPAYIDQVTAMTRGTPYQAGVVAQAQQAKEMGGLAAQPIDAQQRMLDETNALIAKNGRSPALDKRKEQQEKVLSGSQGDLRKDPMRAGLERGVITDLPPLDFTKGIPAVVQQVQARMPGQQRVSVWAGRPVSPLTADEADALGQNLASLKPQDRAGAVVLIGAAIGPQAAQGLAQQINSKDKALGLAFGYSGSQTTNDRYVSELIFRGQQAKNDGTSTKGAKQPEVKAASWRATLAEELRDAYPSQAQADAVLSAAEFIAHGIASEQQGELTSRDLERTARLAAGGPVFELNGRKVAMPAGVDESAINRRMRSVSTEELTPQAPGGTVLAGGVPMPVADFVESLPGQQLIYAGPNRYAVLVGGRPVRNSKGETITIKVN